MTLPDMDAPMYVIHLSYFKNGRDAFKAKMDRIKAAPQLFKLLDADYYDKEKALEVKSALESHFGFPLEFTETTYRKFYHMDIRS